MVTFKHEHNIARTPHRVVVLGASGFVGRHTVRHLGSSGINTLSISSADIDLTSPESSMELSNVLETTDSLVFVSAKAPVKNHKMLLDNIKIAVNVCDALRRTTITHLVYVSSDAVYGDDDEPITEDSIKAPDSLHGVMHLSRELMLKELDSIPKCILRPTLIYGPLDPHNGYGPNRFIRQALSDKTISVFGNGEEQRDHIWIEDVAHVIGLVLSYKSIGQLNICSGSTVSFMQIAEMIQENIVGSRGIEKLPRHGPIPHNGYRPLDASRLSSVFPNFTPVQPLHGIQKCIHGFRGSQM